MELSKTQSDLLDKIKELKKDDSFIKNGLPYFTGINMSHRTGQWHNPVTKESGRSRKSLLKNLIGEF